MSEPQKNLEDFTLVIFGGDGDLATKKLFPSLFYRLRDGQIRTESSIVVVSKNEKTQAEFDEELRAKIRRYVPDAEAEWVERLVGMTSYLCVELTQEGACQPLRDLMETRAHENRIFYYSTPSSIFGIISQALHQAGLITPRSKVVLEKPLGFDLQSFEQLNAEIRSYFAEEQIYRIDHYLGKETVQNLMVLRFANYIFESVWNRRHIDSVEITVAESIGVESRKEYYDRYGALKDMVQNHLIQLLCLVAMEPPAVLSPDNVRDEKLKVLQSLRLYTPDTIAKHTVKGQYTRGIVKGEQVRSYQEDVDAFNSSTETFVALRTYVQNWRWADVPFYMRTGKRMAERYSEIVINFKPVPHNVFPEKAPIAPNKLIIRLQPDEHIELVQMAKIPGPGGYRYESISLELDYKASLGKRIPDAYERLLMDVVRGNPTLFMREDEVRASWVWIGSLTDNWAATGQELELYKAGSFGPGDDVLEPGHAWNKYKND